jgi:hypothetical protein
VEGSSRRRGLPRFLSGSAASGTLEKLRPRAQVAALRSLSELEATPAVAILRDHLARFAPSIAVLPIPSSSRAALPELCEQSAHGPEFICTIRKADYATATKSIRRPAANGSNIANFCPRSWPWRRRGEGVSDQGSRSARSLASAVGESRAGFRAPAGADQDWMRNCRAGASRHRGGVMITRKRAGPSRGCGGDKAKAQQTRGALQSKWWRKPTARNS